MAGPPGERGSSPLLPIPGVSQAAIPARIRPKRHCWVRVWHVAGRPPLSTSVIVGRGVWQGPGHSEGSLNPRASAQEWQGAVALERSAQSAGGAIGQG